jgi:hypothetical protein
MFEQEAERWHGAENLHALNWRMVEVVAIRPVDCHKVEDLGRNGDIRIRDDETLGINSIDHGENGDAVCLRRQDVVEAVVAEWTQTLQMTSLRSDIRSAFMITDKFSLGLTKLRDVD